MAFLLLSACSKPAPDPRPDEALQLYSELKQAYAAYADSLGQIDDTARLTQWGDPLEDRLRKIYESHSPDLDQMLSPAQNDTLWQLASRYIRLKSRLTRGETADSVASDTLPALKTKK